MTLCRTSNLILKEMHIDLAKKRKEKKKIVIEKVTKAKINQCKKINQLHKKRYHIRTKKFFR